MPVATKSLNKRSRLLRSRHGAVSEPEADNCIVLLAVFSKTPGRSSPALNVRGFRHLCRESLPNDIWHKSGSAKIKNLGSHFCVQFRKQDVSIAVEFAERLLATLIEWSGRASRSVYISLGTCDYGANHLLNLAGENQAVVDPTLWKSLTEESRSHAKTANVHSPCFERLSAHVGAVLGQVVNCIPWENLNAE